MESFQIKVPYPLPGNIYILSPIYKWAKLLGSISKCMFKPGFLSMGNTKFVGGRTRTSTVYGGLPGLGKHVCPLSVLIREASLSYVFVSPSRGSLDTLCPKLYRKFVLHLLKYRSGADTGFRPGGVGEIFMNKNLNEI